MLGNTNWWCFDGGSSGQIYSCPCRQSHCTDARLDWRSVKAQVTDNRVSIEPGKCFLQECQQESLVIVYLLHDNGYICLNTHLHNTIMLIYSGIMRGSPETTEWCSLMFNIECKLSSCKWWLFTYATDVRSNISRNRVNTLASSTLGFAE